MKTADLMSRYVVTLSPGNSVAHAARLMLERGISGLPVVDDSGAIVGILTEGDLLRRVEPDSIGAGNAQWLHQVTAKGIARDFVATHSWRVADAMVSPVVTVSEDTPLGKVAELLLSRNIRRLPVVRDGQLVGIISRTDLLASIVAAPAERIAQGDHALRISIEARLREARHMFVNKPTVAVQSGVVHLWGPLASKVERDAARVIVEGVPGIAGFEDHTTLPG
jgi:CBS domain-containing protein